MSANNLKTHYSAKELVGLSLATLPNSVQGIIYQAKKNGWATQKRVGKGGGVEFAVKSMPEEVQAEIVVKLGKSAVKNLPVLAKPQAPVDAQLLWATYEQGTTKQQQKAQMKLGIMCAVAALVDTGVNVVNAFELVCGKHNRECEAKGEMPLSVGSIKRWWYCVKTTSNSTAMLIVNAR